MAKQSILVVDDEVTVLKATQKALVIAGHQVEIASDADAALAACTKQSFDVLILDLMMPNTNGLELLTKIRKIQPAVRSIIISGKLAQSTTEDEISQRLRQQVEADAYLHKPVTNKKLIDSVESVCSPPTTSSWKDIASEMVSESRTSLQAAREASENLQALRRED